MVDCQFCKYFKEHAFINGEYYHYYCALNNKEIEDDWENCTNFEERIIKRDDTMNINKAVQNKDAPGAHAYIRAYDHGAVENEIPYVMHLGNKEDIARALEERMANCVTFDWDDLEEVYDMIEYVQNIFSLPEDQQCEQMINRLRGCLASGESINEEVQGFVYDLFRKLCNDHNIQYADLDEDNIIDAYEYILPKIRKHNGVDTMNDLEKLKEGHVLHIQGGDVIINNYRTPDVWDVEVDHEAAENPLVICYDANNNWLGSIPLEDVKTLETINK